MKAGPLKTSAITAILQHYPAVSVGRLQSTPQAFFGFSGAAVYRVETNQGTFALRQWRQSHLNTDRLCGLHRLLKRIHEAGVKTVAVPVAAKSGETFVRSNDRYWQLELWLPGTADYQESPSRERLRNSMIALAEWHRTARLFEPRDSERQWFRSEPAAASPAVRERLARLRNWQSGRLQAVEQSHRADGKFDEDFRNLRTEISQQFRRHSETVAAELKVVSAVPFKLQPCLRDIWHDHVLFTGDDVSGLIDATACRTENIATDLARLLGSFLGDDTAEWRFALDAYHAVAPLTDLEFRLVRILDRSSVLLSGLTWLDRYFLQQATFSNSTAVIDRLTRLVQRMRRL